MRCIPFGKVKHDRSRREMTVLRNVFDAEGTVVGDGRANPAQLFTPRDLDMQMVRTMTEQLMERHLTEILMNPMPFFAAPPAMEVPRDTFPIGADVEMRDRPFIRISNIA